MKTILLTQGKFAVVDDHNFKWLNKWKWRAQLSNGIWHATRGRTLWMHRVIMDLKFPGLEDFVDHKDHDGLNNLESNLRLANGTQNQANRRLNVDNTSGYKGVSLELTKWRSRIAIRGKKKSLGCFDSKITAAQAYDFAAVTYFGEFAYLNFPENWTQEKINRVHIPGLYLMEVQ